LKGHTVAIEGAFVTRAQKMKSLTEDEVLAFDLEGQAKDYNKMFNDLAGSGSDADLLEPPDRVGRIIERHLWATWIKGEHLAEIAEMMDSPAQKRFGTQTGEQMEAQNHDALSDFGKEINQRLIDLSVEALSGALLQTHWWQRNGDDWESKLMNWARTYKESIAK
jgi:hypothetical protein